MPGWLAVRWALTPLPATPFSAVFLLRIDEGEAGFDGVELVAPDDVRDWINAKGGHSLMPGLKGYWQLGPRSCAYDLGLRSGAGQNKQTFCF